MSEERKIDPKDSRDFLVEAFKIAEGNLGIVPRREHIKSLHAELITHLKKLTTIGNAVTQIAKMAREKKLPKPEDMPYLFALLAGEKLPEMPVPTVPATEDEG